MIVATRRKGEPELTVGDRLVTALIGFVCAFLTMCLVWLIALRYSRGAMEPPLPFYWCGIVGFIAGTFGSLMGPERMMDGFGKVWGVFGAVFRFVFLRHD
jgi:H+/Cl- antiporter ClcA